MAASQIRIDHARCDFCGTCVAVCPTDSINLEESSVFVDHESCSRCLNCVKICPFGVPVHVEVHA